MRTKANQSKPKQTKANQSKPKQTKANQSKPKQTKANQSKMKLKKERLYLVFMLIVGILFLPFGHAAFSENFDNYQPENPLSFQDTDTSTNWDIQTHQRQSEFWYQVTPIDAHHASDCGPPGSQGENTHRVTEYKDTSFLCKGHLMTSIQSGIDVGYALIYLTPNHVVDFSQGPATIQFDISTLNNGKNRDFWDIWITPWEDQLAAPFNLGDVDLQGVPKNSVQFLLTEWDSVCANVYKDFEEVFTWGWENQENCDFTTKYSDFLEQSAMKRQTVEITLSKDHIKVCMPNVKKEDNAPLCWVDHDVDIPFDKGIVQFGHHSYTPWKDGSGGPNTWHWDNFVIEPSIPYTIIKADRRIVDQQNNNIIFDSSAPQNSFLRFTGIGTIEASFDNGAYETITPQPGSVQGEHVEHASNYFHEIPQGTKEVSFRFSSDDWYQGPYHAKDFALFSMSQDENNNDVDNDDSNDNSGNSDEIDQDDSENDGSQSDESESQKSPICGNNIKEEGEGCDDGNTNKGDGCSPTCQSERTTTFSNNRITWQGKEWYLHGANVPWYAWACDFGCTTQNGVIKNKKIIKTEFEKAVDAGMHVLRWWVFPGENPWQIKESEGTITIDPKIYEDFDAALQIAEELDITYTFVLFSAPSHIDSSWLTNQNKRQKVAEALRPLFKKYGTHPRIMTWEIFNEPGNDIWTNPDVHEEDVKAFVNEIARIIHEETHSYVTIGGVFIDEIKIWKNTDLDYFDGHWYDYMQPGDWCTYCTDYTTVANRYSIDKPIIIGEFYAGEDVNQEINRFKHWYENGYAGAYAWSLFWDQTHDKLKIDYAAAKEFADGISDNGPRNDLSLQECNDIIDNSIQFTHFGSPIDQFTNELMMSAMCQENKVKVTLSTSEDETVLYQKGYYFSDSKWNEITFSDQAWTFDQKEIELPYNPEEKTYLIAYMCRNVNNQWKCGCKDSTCATQHWQIQII